MVRRPYMLAGLVVAGTLFGLPIRSTLAQTRPPDSDFRTPTVEEYDRVSGTLDLLHEVATDGRPDPIFGWLDGASEVNVTIRHNCGGERQGSVPRRTSYETETLPWSELPDLAGRRCVRRIEPARMPGSLPALEETTESVGIAASHVRPRGRVHGDGTTIALLDSPVDIVHPAFFRPDAGRHEWIDVDGDGELTIGVDAVDLNENGRADHNETLHLFEATTITHRQGEEETEGMDGRFQPDRDWLYADRNGNGKRDAGPGEGFQELDPGYAEPTFVVDDVDRDGRLEPHEPLYRLGTSKIERLVLDDATYVRGEDLVQALQSDLPNRSSHGTAVAGILVGGQLGFHRRVGVAPRADLVVIGKSRRLHDDGDGQLAALRRIEHLDVDVFLTEWTNPFTRPLDGSTNVERAMDELRDSGTAQVVPVGNLNESKKHLEVTVEPDASIDANFRIPERLRVDGSEVDITSAFGTLQWHSSEDLSLSLRPPNGPERDLDPEEDSIDFSEFDVRVARDRTPSGTTVVTIYATGRNIRGEPISLPTGEWRIALEGADVETRVVGRITDPHSGWSPGIRWTKPTRDRGTIAYPATADSAIGVAAFAGRNPTGSSGIEPGDLRGYSGRGPRIDGARAVDIAAPDNPFVPIANTPANRRNGWQRGGYRQFGGTSGAAPHVAGALALLRQGSPSKPFDVLVPELLETADTDGLTPDHGELPNRAWGAGRLDLYRALYGEPTPRTQTPTAELAVETRDQGLRYDASASRDPDGDDLTFRFDFDHDGRWETDWRPDPVVVTDISVVASTESSDGPSVGRVEVRDVHGARSGALALLPALGGETGDAGTADATTDAGGSSDVDDPVRRRRGDKPGPSCFGCGLSPSPLAPPLSGLLVLGSLVLWRRLDRHG